MDMTNNNDQTHSQSELEWNWSNEWAYKRKINISKNRKFGIIGAAIGVRL